jgi:hypothetical protein
MELDDLKPAWQRLEQDLELQKRITERLLSEQRSTRVEASLKPLLVWQVLQIIAGIALAMVAAQAWLTHRAGTLQFVSGLVVHVYAVALIIGGARIVQLLLDIDYAAPVVELQRRIAQLERSYITSGWILGLPWWLLWIPVSLVLLEQVGIDVSSVPPSAWLPANVIICSVGMLLTVVGYQWARRSTKPGVAKRLERMVSAASIVRAKQALADIERFERNGDPGEGESGS